MKYILKFKGKNKTIQKEINDIKNLTAVIIDANQDKLKLISIRKVKK